MLGVAPGTLGRSILILEIAVSLKHRGIVGKVGCTDREMDGAASKKKQLENCFKEKRENMVECNTLYAI